MSYKIPPPYPLLIKEGGFIYDLLLSHCLGLLTLQQEVIFRKMHSATSRMYLEPSIAELIFEMKMEKNGFVLFAHLSPNQEPTLLAYTEKNTDQK